MKKIMVIAAHPDDEILGLGGTIKKHAINRDIIDCLILGEGMTSRTSNRKETGCELIADLHEDTMRSARIIGFRKVYFSNLPDNRFDSVNLLDIIKIVESYIKELKPDVIYTHHYGDLNVDHRLTFEAVITACRPVGEYSVKEIYTFETPSSTEWNFNSKGSRFVPNTFIDIEETIEDKLNAMTCYKTELGAYPHPRSLESLKIIAARWGTVVGRKYVEAFELIMSVR